MKMANLIKGDSTIQPFRSLHIQCFYSILDGPHPNPKGRIQVSWPMFVPLNLKTKWGCGPNIIKKWKGVSPKVVCFRDLSSLTWDRILEGLIEGTKPSTKVWILSRNCAGAQDVKLNLTLFCQRVIMAHIYSSFFNHLKFDVASFVSLSKHMLFMKWGPHTTSMAHKYKQFGVGDLG